MSLTIDASDFSRAVRALSGKTGVSTRRALEYEAGKVLGQCVKRTQAAKVAKPKGGGFAREGDATVSVNTTGKGGSPIGRAWLREPGAKGKPTNFIIRGPGELRHWSDARWQRAQALLQKAEGGKGGKRKDKVTGRGLAKASWVQIGAMLGIGISPSPPSYVLTALPQDGIRRVSGRGRRMETGEQFILELENVYPLLTGGAKKGSSGLDGAAILNSALTMRASYVTRAIEQGWLDDTKKTCQRFPGLTVS